MYFVSFLSVPKYTKRNHGLTNRRYTPRAIACRMRERCEHSLPFVPLVKADTSRSRRTSFAMKPCTLLLLGLTLARAGTLNFLAVGDWGGQDTDPYTRPGEIAAASGMASIAQQLGAKFVLGLGDNFYYSGKQTPILLMIFIAKVSTETRPTFASRLRLKMSTSSPRSKCPGEYLTFLSLDHVGISSPAITTMAEMLQRKLLTRRFEKCG